MSIVDYNDKAAINKELQLFEKSVVNESTEMALVITKDGKVYQCFGTRDRVFPDFDLGEEFKGASVTHNHLATETTYSFSKDDLLTFIDNELKLMRGCDDKYTYVFTRDATQVDDMPEEMTFENFSHASNIKYAKEYGIGYRRWLNE